MIQPSYQQIKLCKDTAQKLVYETKVLQETPVIENKLFLQKPDFFLSSSVPLTAIFELIPIKACTLNIKQLTGTNKLISFIKNIFFSSFLKEAGVDDKIFKDCLSIVKSVPFYRIERPVGLFTVQQQIDMVKSLIARMN